jgi:hypothetical protein
MAITTWSSCSLLGGAFVVGHAAAMAKGKRIPYKTMDNLITTRPVFGFDLRRPLTRTLLGGSS